MESIYFILYPVITELIDLYRKRYIRVCYHKVTFTKCAFKILCAYVISGYIRADIPIKDKWNLIFESNFCAYCSRIHIKTHCELMK